MSCEKFKSNIRRVLRDLQSKTSPAQRPTCYVQPAAYLTTPASYFNQLPTPLLLLLLLLYLPPIFLRLSYPPYYYYYYYPTPYFLPVLPYPSKPTYPLKIFFYCLPPTPTPKISLPPFNFLFIPNLPLLNSFPKLTYPHINKNAPELLTLVLSFLPTPLLFT